jgi:hypothetical protein
MVTADKQNGEWTLLSQVIHNRAHEHGLTVEEAKRWWRGRLAPGDLKVRWLLDKVQIEIEKDGEKEKLLRFYRSDQLTADFWDLCKINPIFSLAELEEISLQGVEVYVPHLVEEKASEPPKQATASPAADQASVRAPPNRIKADAIADRKPGCQPTKKAEFEIEVGLILAEGPPAPTQYAFIKKVRRRLEARGVKVSPTSAKRWLRDMGGQG